MYTSFVVKNFRNLRNLSVDDFQRINIITGKNNAGKTALMEAMFLHVGANNPLLTVSLHSFRGFPRIKLDADSLWGSLFYDYDTNVEIVLTGRHSDQTQATLTISLIPSQIVAYPPNQRRDFPVTEKPTQVPLLADRDLKYEYHEGETTVARITKITPQGFSIDPPVAKSDVPGFFIPARYQLDYRPYAERFGELTLRRLDHYVVDFLKLLQPDLKSLTIIPMGPDSMIHADIPGRARLFPIQILGEGMARIAEIVIDIASAPNGVVFIDDIDTGIHHSVLMPFWQSVYLLCKRINAQLFATTHSAECLEAAHRVFSKMDLYDLSIFRLQRVEGELFAVRYDNKSLAAAIESGLEVR